MSDWTGQAQAGVDRWIAAQREWWEAVQGPAAAGGVPDMGRQAVETWRAAAHRVADAQADLLLQTLGAAAPAQPEELVGRWTEQFMRTQQEWARQWSEQGKAEADAP